MTKHSTSALSYTGQTLAGLLLIAAGVFFLLRELGYYFPEWLLTWPMLLVLSGLFTWLVSGFRGFVGLLMAAIGGVLLINQRYPEVRIFSFIWPAIAILTGIWIIFGKKTAWQNCSRKYSDRKSRTTRMYTQPESKLLFEPVPSTGLHAESLEIISVFGGASRMVHSENFRGGEIITFMGGAEINLTQSDIQGKVELEVIAVLGGVKLIVPPHWMVVSEMITVMGGMEDNRMQPENPAQSGKVLVIKGTAVLGGIEIECYA
jgi:hypothetical protein